MIPLLASGIRAGLRSRLLSTSSSALARALPRNSAMRKRESALQAEISDLERQLRRAEKKEIVAQLTRDLPPLDDATLEAIYRDLLTPPPAQTRPALAPPPQRVVAALAARVGPQKDTELITASDQESRRMRREHILASISSADTLSMPDEDEWSALAAESAADGDMAHLEKVLSCMDDCGVLPTIDVYARAMEACAARGSIEQCVALADALAQSGLAPNDRVKHALVKVYTNNGLIYPAMQQLAQWEESEPAPQQSYALVIDNILRHPVRSIHPTAWTLFHRMRFAAHPVPDAHMYALMIRACAAGVCQPNEADMPGRKRLPIADAERALDMFREMTEFHNIEPTKEVYDSLILTLARRREHYGDARRILRMFFDNETDYMRADAYTFNAFLQGVARTGDLPVARWVLAEMLRSSLNGARGPNEESMTYIFWAYAVYKPPHVIKPKTSGAAKSLPESSESAPVQVESPGRDLDAAAPSTFTDIVPRTSAEILAEARALMARIFADQEDSQAPAVSLDRPLAMVKPSVRLLNAFLSVLTHHLPPAQRLAHVVHQVEDDDGVFAQARLEPNGHTLALVLETAALHSDRKFADSVAQRMWARWQTISKDFDEASISKEASLISRVWSLMIRNYAKSFNTEAGIAMLGEFLERYPPPTRKNKTRAAAARTADVAPVDTALDLAPTPPPSKILDALRRLPRMSPTNYATLTPQYPRLTFRDLELLHHRCVALRDVRALNLITRADREYRM
ncbi:hypothetical protein MCUN1_001612 [Malassezia cuniculi]|uniref:Uncharacterized protein n=1 Tax=Malassezia cuniculi TaxID=948313 RepID=A0AAF0J608_9BASI|nr:hypothetical protein MCUN1_001612 [Malassezia cuniculi]